MTSPPTVFALPDHLSAKSRPALVAADDRHLAAVAAALRDTVAEVADRLDTLRRAPGRSGQAALERDQDIHRTTARLAALRRSGADLCLGRMVPADGSGPVYVGRLGLSDARGRRLLVDWRTPAAEPFVAATPAHPAGLVSRRRYRWTEGRITDYWDEVLDPEAAGADLAPDDQSAFIAGLAAASTPRMRDVLATIQVDQDAAVRAPARGALVVDGGPGTGKTVVALHRAAYLLHADPSVGRHHGGVLLVGPSRGYLAYTADVLPRLGEDGVRACTLTDLVPEGATAGPEPEPQVAALKGTAAMVDAVEPAVRFSERVPTEELVVRTPWTDVPVSLATWAQAFGTPDPGTPHNEARDVIWDALLDLLVEQAQDDEGPVDDETVDDWDELLVTDLPEDDDVPDEAEILAAEQAPVDRDVPPEVLRRELDRSAELRAAVDRAWPVLDAPDLVADLWSIPAYLRLCAPWLDAGQVAALQRPDPYAWTTADLPLLDAARHRLGDPRAAGSGRRRLAREAAEREYRSQVIDDLVAADDDFEGLATMLLQPDLSDLLLEEPDRPVHRAERLAGPFAHAVVDEAQELTDAQWRMLLRRVPSRSLTVVGDRAQARHPFPEPWTERLARVGADRAKVITLTVNYRTPAEVMTEAAPVIRAVLPDANVPTSVRSSGYPVHHGAAADLARVVDDWLAEHPEGTAAVIGAAAPVGRHRVRSLTAAQVKGLEFDLVVLVVPAPEAARSTPAPTAPVAGAAERYTEVVDRYVAMTRTTGRLVLLADGPDRPTRSAPALG